MHRLALLVLLAATPASADVFKLFGEAHGGGLYGVGTAGDQKDSAFFAKSPHGAYGALVGAEFFFFDGWIQHHQFTDGSRLTTWTEFGLGVHYIDEMGEEKDRKVHQNGYVELGFGAVFGRSEERRVGKEGRWRWWRS